MRKSCEDYRSKPFLGYRPLVRMESETRKVETKTGTAEKIFQIPVCKDYTFLTYQQAEELIDQFASGLRDLGVEPKDHISIYAETKKEWMISMMAALTQNVCVVTVYATLGADALPHSFNETHVKLVIADAANVPNVLEASKECKELRTIVYFDKLNEKQQKEVAKYSDVKLFSFDEVVSKGKTKGKVSCGDPATPEDAAIIMYTSGTTGKPKGIQVTHKNFIAVVAAVNDLFGHELSRFTKVDQVYLCYLPLAHILELACETVMLARGSCLGYSSPRTLMDVKNEEGKKYGDIIALKPTWMAAVPAVMDRFRSGILDNIEKKGPIVKALFKVAYYFKRREYLEGHPRAIWDKAVFGKVQEMFGGRLGFFISGGAALGIETQEFMNVVLGVPVLQGYGLTETCAGSTICHPDDRTYGRVGAPLPCCEIKLVDVPEMGYKSSNVTEEGLPNESGEICISGASVANGYFGQEKLTKESFKPDNTGKIWFYTGDIGKWHLDGTLEIIDRKKDLVKLKHGEYLSLGSLESMYGHNDYVERVFCTQIHNDLFLLQL